MCHIEAVIAIRIYLIKLREALLESIESDGNNDVKCGAHSLAFRIFEKLKFLIDMSIWYEILFVMILISNIYDLVTCLLL